MPPLPAQMPSRQDLTDALIALILEDGSRITNDQIHTALEQEAGESISDAELKEIKSLVVAMGAAEGVKGPGGGLKAPGVAPPTRATNSPHQIAPPLQAAPAATAMAMVQGAAGARPGQGGDGEEPLGGG